MRRTTKGGKDFYSFVKKGESCWIWTGTKIKAGYGLYWYDGHFVLAHRWIWKSLHGDIPSSTVVMHKCDVKCCVNPDHLQSGTQIENMADARNKGRVPGNRKLKESIVKEIREEYQLVKGMDGEIRKLAKKYGVCATTIWHIGNRHTWKRLD